VGTKEHRRPGPARPPSKATIWRMITDADAEVFDATVGSGLMSSLPGDPAGQAGAAGADRDDPVELMAVRLDGKTVRGAKDAAGNQRHLLAALAGPARTPRSSPPRPRSGSRRTKCRWPGPCSARST